jgi:glutamate-5-semialdehyde dehydrogenase
MVEVPVKLYIGSLLKQAKEAVHPTALLASATKTAALTALAERLTEQEEALLEANRLDVEAVGKGLEREAARRAVERLRLHADDVKRMADSLRRVAELPDPVGQVTGMQTRPNGMQVSRVRAPIGVVAVISELGPGIMLQTLALCLKSGNPCIYRGSADWTRTVSHLAESIAATYAAAGVPAGAVAIVNRPEKEAALELIRQPKFIDAVVARGGVGLQKTVMEQSRVPVLCHDGGISHLYIDGDADLPMAQNLVINSKVQDPGAGNAIDTLLVHQGIARTLLPALVRRLLEEFKVDVHGCPKTIAITGSVPISGHKSVVAATDEDWDRQFRERDVAVRVVADYDDALAHIRAHGPSHSDAIITRSYTTAMRFAREVDAQTVLINASTRLDDGEEYGEGPELGYSPFRLHARGPLTLERLTCERQVVLGTGQLRQPHPVPVAYEDAIMLKRPS